MKVTKLVGSPGPGGPGYLKAPADVGRFGAFAFLGGDKMARTLAEAQTLRDKVKAAYERAIDAESYGVTSGGESRSLQRPRIETLKKQLDDLETEIERLKGGGIIPRGITPVG